MSDSFDRMYEAQRRAYGTDKPQESVQSRVRRQAQENVRERIAKREAYDIQEAGRAPYRERLRRISNQMLSAADDPNRVFSLNNNEAFGLMRLGRDRSDRSFLEAASTNAAGQDKSFWGYMPFLGTLAEGSDQDALEESSKRVNAGTGTREDYDRLADFLNWSEREMGGAGIAGAIGGELFSFMGETWGVGLLGKAIKLGAGAARAGSAGARAKSVADAAALVATRTRQSAAFQVPRMLARDTGRAVMGDAAARNLARMAGVPVRAMSTGLGQTVGKEAISNALSLFGDTQRSRTINAAHLAYLQDKYQYDASVFGVGVAVDDSVELFRYLPKAFVDQFIENWSEATGATLTEGLSLMNKVAKIKFMDDLLAKRLGKGKSMAQRRMWEATQKVGWDGIIEEGFEEVMGAGAKQVLGWTGAGTFELDGYGQVFVGGEEWSEEYKQWLDYDQWWGMALGLALGGGTTATIAAGLQRAVDATDPSRFFKRLSREGERLRAELGAANGRAQVREALGAGDRANVPAVNEEAEARRLLMGQVQQKLLREEAEARGVGVDELTDDDKLTIINRNADKLTEEADDGLAEWRSLDEAGRAKQLEEWRSFDTPIIERVAEEEEAPAEGEAPEVAAPAEGAPAEAAPAAPAPAPVAAREGELVLFDEDPQKPGELAPAAVERDREIYEENRRPELGRQGDALGVGTASYDELTPHQQRLVNMHQRQGVKVLFRKGGEGRAAAMTRADGTIVYSIEGTMQNTTARGLDGQGRPVDQALTGQAALDSHFLHEAVHRLVQKYGKQWLDFMARNLDRVMPGIRAENAEQYTQNWKAFQDAEVAAGRQRPADLTEQELYEESVSRTLEMMFPYLGALAKANNTQQLEKLISQGVTQRGFWGRVWDAMRAALSVIPGVGEPRLESMKFLREAIEGVDNLTEQELAGQAAIVQEFANAWIGAGVEAGQEVNNLLSWQKGLQGEREAAPAPEEAAQAPAPAPAAEVAPEPQAAPEPAVEPAAAPEVTPEPEPEPDTLLNPINPRTGTRYYDNDLVADEGAYRRHMESLRSEVQRLDAQVQEIRRRGKRKTSAEQQEQAQLESRIGELTAYEDRLSKLHQKRRARQRFRVEEERALGRPFYNISPELIPQSDAEGQEMLERVQVRLADPAADPETASAEILRDIDDSGSSAFPDRMARRAAVLSRVLTPEEPRTMSPVEMRVATDLALDLAQGLEGMPGQELVPGTPEADAAEAALPRFPSRNPLVDSVASGLDPGYAAEPFAVRANKLQPVEQRPGGVGFTQQMDDPSVTRRTTGMVDFGGEAGGAVFHANTVRDDMSAGRFEVEAPTIAEGQRAKFVQDVAHHAMRTGAQTVSFLEAELADAFGEMVGAKPVVRNERYEIDLKATMYEKAGPQYAYGAQLAFRDRMEMATEARLFEDNDARFNINPDKADVPAPDSARDSVMVDYRKVNAYLDFYLGRLDKSYHAVQLRGKKYEDRLLALMPEELKGKPFAKRNWVGRMDRAMHLWIDLSGSESGKSIEELLTEFEQAAAAKDMKLSDRQAETIRDVRNMPQEVRFIADELATHNHMLGTALANAGMINEGRRYYTARIWFMDSEELALQNLTSEIGFGMGQSLDPTKAGVRFRRGLGARAKARTYDNILEGWLDGRKLSIDRALVAQEKVHSDAMEALATNVLLKQLESVGAVYLAPTKMRPRRGVKMRAPGNMTRVISNAPTMDGVWAVPELANELSALTNVFQPGEFLRTAYKIQAVTKSTLLFTSLFHHQAFMRSYYYSLPLQGAGAEASALGDLFWASAASVTSLFSQDQATRVLMKSKGAREGYNAIMSMSPELDDLVDAGLTVAIGMDYAAKADMDSDWRKTWMERAIARGETGRRWSEALADHRIETSNWLFNKLGNSLKAQAALMEYRHMLFKNADALANGQITKARIAEIVAAKTNDDFGGLNLRRRKHSVFGKGPRRSGWQFFLRMVMLAPDWTESNFNTIAKIVYPTSAGRDIESPMSAKQRALERGAYASLYAKSILRAQIPTQIFNIMMAGFDPDEDVEEMYARMWEKPEKLAFLKADVTVVARAINQMFGPRDKQRYEHPDTRYYFNTMGHFLDPAKWVLGLGFDIMGPLKAKGSPFVRAGLSALSGRNWRGQVYTNAWPTEDQGDKDLLWDGTIAAWDFQYGLGIAPRQALSFLADQILGSAPIFGQSLVGFAVGEDTAFTALADSFGAHMTKIDGEQLEKARARGDFVIGRAR